MTQIARLAARGLFGSTAPRYTSYPTAPVFSVATGADHQTRWLAALPPGDPVSVYVHIPFCERLCWFCACHTQGTQTLGPVEHYLDAVEQELAMVRASLPEGVRMGRLHWGGGTPTILPPPLIHRLAQAIKAAIPPAEEFEFSIEIDPMMVDEAKILALAAEGMTRASIGIQDFSPIVQAAIGREQPFEDTRACVDMLRRAGVTSLNADLVYGLPHQTLDLITDTIDKVLTLGPDRIALFGYAHVPHMSRRQKLIDETVLPGDEDRYGLFFRASQMFRDAGLEPVGIDHFARPGDSLAEAARGGHMRRNFQGYTVDTCQTLIGIGASSISRFPQGYVQNAPATAAYLQRVGGGALAGARGHAFAGEDLLRARAIEMLMCEFRLDRAALAERFGAAAAVLDPVHDHVAQLYGDVVEVAAEAVRILPEGRPLTRLIAQCYDGYGSDVAIYSKTA